MIITFCASQNDLNQANHQHSTQPSFMLQLMSVYSRMNIDQIQCQCDLISQLNFIFYNMSQAQKSRLQEKFRTTTIYKRSKQYFDINRLNRMEKQQQLSRRKPRNPEVDHMGSRFEESFYNTDNKLNERVQTEISKCYTKNCKEDQIDETQTNYTFINNLKGKTLDMNKMISRTYYQKQVQFNRNQRHFCNFKPYSLPHNHTIDFERICVPARVSNFKAKTRQCSRPKCKQKQGEETSFISPPEIGILKQKLRFDQSLFKTLVDFKQNDKQKSQRSRPVEEPVRHLDRIKLGQNLTRKKIMKGLLEFYHGEAKWSAPQMDNRLLKQNEHFLKQQNKLDEKRIDWTMIKRKTDLLQTRRRQIMARKDIKDVKGQFCDEMFFRRNYL